MKILLVANYFLYPSSNGGANMCRCLANGLRNAGHDVVVSCIDFSTLRNAEYASRQVEQDGLRVLAIRPHERQAGFVKPLWRMRPDPKMAAIAEKLIITENPDIVYVNGGWEIGEFVLTARELKIPITFHAHCFGHLCAMQFLSDGNGRICSGPETSGKCFRCLQIGQRLIRSLLEKFSTYYFGKRLVQSFFGKAKTSSFLLGEAIEDALNYTRKLRNSVNTFIVTSELIAGIHEKYGVSRQRMHVLPHFLPQDRLERSSLDERDNKNRVRLGYFGRMTAEKGFDLLLNTLSDVEKILPRMFDLWVISREADRSYILARLSDAGISPDRLRVFCNLTGSALNPVLANLDICIIPSLCYEIGPLTMLETMAQGVPCIVSDSVGMSSLIQDGKNGRLFPVGDANALKDVLTDLLKQPDIIENWRAFLPEISDEQTYMNHLSEILYKTKDFPIL
ncbi:MAG: glycosyltransferase family 4 protein [Desulfobacteraceae bacterium]|nr:glycosyltransferase family 4 protein [Desulfobacteraceae bacterium]